jgi:hypothetical protein
MPAGHDISAGYGEQLYRSVLTDTTRSSTTAAAQPDLTVPLDLGSWVYNYYLVLQSAATTTGHKFDINFTGAVAAFANNIRWVTAASAAADDVPDQDHVAAPGGVVSGFTARAVGTTGTGQTTDVDAINADVLYIVEGIARVTVIGNLELYWAPEAAANATMRAGSSLILWKTG